MKGYNGKFLRVDLSSGNISVDSPSEDYYRLYLGGRGFIIEKLLSELPAGTDPLGSENKLIFALGPMSGHPIPGGGRNSIGAKSPLTGTFGESEVGGFWGAELKRAGFDAVIIEGASPRPVYLKIENGLAEIRDAADIWGLEVADAQKVVREELGGKKFRTAAIGPAGENLVRFACILNDVSHAAGRTGMGAVMGSKKLKLIAVKGDKAPEMAQREKILEMARVMTQNTKEKPTGFSIHGTGGAITNFAATGNLPVRNFQGGLFPGVKEISPQRMKEKGYWDKMESCFGCPVRCKKKLKSISAPWPVDPTYGGPEYETLAALGSNCGIDNLEAVMKGHELCGRFGLDTISAGATIAFAMECTENGILARKDTDGIDLAFGNADAMVQMIERIALRKGFGNLLAEGTQRAAESIGKGAHKFAIHVKGNEIPMHEPRLKQGLGLHYSVHAGGADHCTGIHDERLDTAAMDRIDMAEAMPPTELSPRKVRALYQFGMWRQMTNYIGMCLFLPWSQNQIMEAMEYITGWPMSYWRLMKTTERGITLSRIFNLREGLSGKDDTLPARFYTPHPDGPLKEVSVDPGQLAEAQKLYYQMLGWDASGVPTYARLVELNLEWAYEHLKKTVSERQQTKHQKNGRRIKKVKK
ncbi:MAG: aldehyde ferredoxin oxidoreductase family protein [Desulfobacterales bacterium]|nr:aldehyde ferredoxin oxidoreductase family protein [Desulfobacterales bacterium]